jgi:hypothetical protein
MRRLPADAKTLKRPISMTLGGTFSLTVVIQKAALRRALVALVFCRFFQPCFEIVELLFSNHHFRAYQPFRTPLSTLPPSNAMERHIELGDVGANIQPQTSTFYSRRRQVKRLRFQSDEYSTRGGSNISGSLDRTPITQSLLLILRLLSYYKIQLFSVDPSQKWNLRQTLGEGSTFSVDGADLPIWRALSNLKYRNLDLKGPGEKFYFNDHTQTKWDHNTLVAYKALVTNKDMDRSVITVDMITELRVLCHPLLVLRGLGR